ncbi:50S ribosomal protein L19 [Candidatus Eisenbacteria bacterium]|uniref:Large ribosomal subunit protein bL19 n=1 Tax=Eiseniibacteriota bacterium TaxID=2212470 RepID=A0ABV6YJW3_UNCEI
MDVIKNIEAPHIKDNVPDFAPGDTVKLSVRVVEGDKVRTQAFQGVVISRDQSGASETLTVRKISDGVGIERIFPLHSPNLESIEVVRRGKVRRAKLTYMRGRKGKSARIKEGAMQRVAKGKGAAAAAKPKAATSEAATEESGETTPDDSDKK